MEISISVRNLVEFILRSGDIDNRKTQTAPEDAMQEGGRIHRMIQRSMGADYRAEVFLKYRYHTENNDILVDGRADGIMQGLSPSQEALAAQQKMQTEQNTEEKQKYQSAPVIDEIKGTYRDLEKMKEPVPVHLAQAKCYAYMYAVENSLPYMRVRMTYCNMDTEEIRYFFFEYTFGELEAWFLDILRSYKKWADFTYEWKLLRQESIKALDFPFPYREGQKQLVSYVYQTIYHKKKLFIEAPTGVGKTISTVFPSVKAMGEDLAEKIFYLTAKTITRTVAAEAFEQLRNTGLKFKTVVITAKEKICFQEEPECNPAACPYAKGHFDRINDAIYDMLISEDSFSREKVEVYAQKHKVCPFEMCLDMSLFADAVICDYNYVFDPHAYLRRFFSEGVSRDYIFLVDEAHNLVDRGRDMYSAVLRKEDFLTLKKSIKVYDARIYSALEKCNRQFLLLKRECENYLVLDSVDDLILALGKLGSRIEEFLEKHEDSPIRKEVLEFYFELQHFLLIYDKVDDNYVMYSENESDGSFIVKLFCVNPAKNLLECMVRGRSTVLFSATLLPIQYYKKLLGGLEEDYEVYARSIFDPSKKGLFIGRDVTSRYSGRGPQLYRQVAAYIHQVISVKSGNYMVFFPSHAFLKNVWEAYQEEFAQPGHVECLLQEEFMKEQTGKLFWPDFSKILRLTDRSSQWKMRKISRNT